jgi:hypothetical protein
VSLRGLKWLKVMRVGSAGGFAARGGFATGGGLATRGGIPIGLTAI